MNAFQAWAGIHPEAARGRPPYQHEENVRQQILAGLITDKGGAADSAEPAAAPDRGRVSRWREWCRPPTCQRPTFPANVFRAWALWTAGIRPSL